MHTTQNILKFYPLHCQLMEFQVKKYLEKKKVKQETKTKKKRSPKKFSNLCHDTERPSCSQKNRRDEHLSSLGKGLLNMSGSGESGKADVAQGKQQPIGAQWAQLEPKH